MGKRETPHERERKVFRRLGTQTSAWLFTFTAPARTHEDAEQSVCHDRDMCGIGAFIQSDETSMQLGWQGRGEAGS